MKIFISYSSKEYNKARDIFNVLKENGFDCWMAPESIRAGRDFGEEIPIAIEKSDVFLLVLSRASQASKWVKKELDMAITFDKRIMPFHIDDSTLTLPFTFRLIDVQVKRASEGYERLIEELNANDSSGYQDRRSDKSITIWKKTEKFIKCLSIRFLTKNVIVVFILLFIVATGWGIIQFLSNNEETQKPAETVDKIAAENESPAITNIGIFDSDITLTPSKPWQELKVTIYPPEANISDVQCTSDNPNLAIVKIVKEEEKRYVQLASYWEKETERSTTIRVQFEEIRAEATVAVMDNTVEDWRSGADNSIQDDDGSISTERLSEF